MADGLCRPTGLARPRYFDRQVVYADDLTLEQTHQDLLARRLNRFLHGWGVVAGFELAIQENKDVVGLEILPGYGLTPLGDEVYLPEPIDVDSILDLARAAGCDCGEVDCDDLGLGGKETDAGDEKADGKKPPPSDGEPDSGDPKTVFLVARPGATADAARPAAPEGCGHPGNHMAFSRTCGRVCIEVVCTLEPPHVPEKIDCPTIEKMVCAPADQRPVPAMPAPVGESSNFVVLGAIELTAKGIVGVSLEPRRTLLSVETLQNWLRCLCGEKGSSEETKTKQVMVEEVTGIGPARTEQLKQNGIFTAADLAERSPAGVAKILGMSKEAAAKLLDEAAALVAAAKTPAK